MEPGKWVEFDVIDGEVEDTYFGPAHDEKFQNAIIDGYDIELVCENEPEVEGRIKARATFTVKLVDTEIVVEPGHWNLDYGWDIGAYWLEYESLEITALKRRN